MRRGILVTAACTAALMVTLVNAQSAMRCEVNGKIVYGDTACAPGSASRAVAPIQETAEQKAAAKAASEQIRKDTAYVDKRLDDRYKRDTARTAGLDAAAKDKTAAKAKGRAKSSLKASKAKSAGKHSAGRKATGKTGKKGKTGTESSRAAPKA